MLHPRSFINRPQTEQFSPRQFLENCLETIQQHEPNVLAFTHLDIDGARRQADLSTDRWKKGSSLSAIDGMPVGIKDIIYTRDMPTQMGSALFTGWQPDDDAASVKALREAGAVIVGKTVTTEFAATVPGDTRNPHDPKRTPGGSSSGSAAAVGSGMLAGALGTQVVGSILRPASYCGCVGFKPSLGAINRGGSLDFLSQSVTGVLGASLGDAWALACEIANRVGGDPGRPGLIGTGRLPRSAMPSHMLLFTPGNNAIAEPSALKVLNAVRAKLEQEDVKVTNCADSPALRELEETLSHAMQITQEINAWESVWPLNTYADRDASKLSTVMVDRLAQGRSIGGAKYRELISIRREARQLYAQLAGPYDCCLALSAAGPAPLGLSSTGSPLFAVPSSYLGVPAISLPAGLAESMPMGIQLLGFRDQDERLMANGAWIETLLMAE